MVEILAATIALNKLNNGKDIRNKDKYPVLKTNTKTPEEFWNSLNYGRYHIRNKKRQYHTKIDVGGIAIHHGFMTPRTCRFDITNTQFKNLTKWQQKVIKSVLETKDEPYTIVGLRALCGDLFRIK